MQWFKQYLRGWRGWRFAVLMALVSFVFYTFIGTWQFALLLMAAIGFHECGHLYAAKYRGIGTRGFIFIPPFGGIASINGNDITTAEQWGFIALAGPLVGVVMAAGALGLFVLTGNDWWGAATALIAMINLFNLLPIYPLDGGRVWHSIAHSIRPRLGSIMMIGGVVAAAGMFLYSQEMIYLVIGGLSAWEQWKFFSQGRTVVQSCQTAIARCDQELLRLGQMVAQNAWVTTDSRFRQARTEWLRTRAIAQANIDKVTNGVLPLTLFQGVVTGAAYGVIGGLLIAALVAVSPLTSWSVMRQVLMQ